MFKIKMLAAIIKDCCQAFAVAALWLAMQAKHDLWEAERTVDVSKIPTLEHVYLTTILISTWTGRELSNVQFLPCRSKNQWLGDSHPQIFPP